MEDVLKIFIDIIVSILNIFKDVVTNEYFLSLATILSSFAIMQITLSVQRGQHKTELQEQKTQFDSSLEAQEQHHRETLFHSEESLRVSMLPYLFLEHDVEIGSRCGNPTFPLELKNVGNGIAFEVSIEYEVDSNSVIYVSKKQFHDCTVYYRYTGHISLNVLTVGNKCNFELMLDFVGGDESEYAEFKGSFAGEIRFSVTFNDAFKNTYRQEFMLIFSLNHGCRRFESYSPELIKRNTVALNYDSAQKNLL